MSEITHYKEVWSHRTPACTVVHVDGLARAGGFVHLVLAVDDEEYNLGLHPRRAPDKPPISAAACGPRAFPICPS